MVKKLVALTALSFLFVLTLSGTAAAQDGNVFQRVFDILASIFALDFLGNDEAKLGAFLRGIIWITVFTVIFNVVKRLGDTGGTVTFNRGSAIVLAGVFATATTVFLPPDFLIVLGEAYSTIMAAVLIGIVVLFILVINYQMLPGMGISGWALHGVRILFLLLLFYLLELISGYVSITFTPFVPLVLAAKLSGIKPGRRKWRF